jgi:DUF917 family protein
VITRETLPLLANGSRLLATGATESSYQIAYDWAMDVLSDVSVPLVTAADLPADTMCVAVSLVGSTTAMEEQLPSGDEPIRVVRALEHRLGQRVGAVVALNLAAENALLPVITAAMAGVPLVDGDGSGRVFPLVEQTTYTLGGISATPLAFAGPGGELVVVETDRLEQLLRPVVLSVGGWGLAACYPMSAAALASSVVPGTVGRLMRAGGPSATRALAAPYGLSTLCRGRIVSVETSSGHGRVQSLPSSPTSIVVLESDGLRRLVRLEAHNEIVLALADGSPVAMVPDQVCMLAADGSVVDVDMAVEGQEVEVVVVTAPPAWHTERGRALGGLSAFGVEL